MTSPVPAYEPFGDPLGDAVTVLSHINIKEPSKRLDTEDAANRVTTALGYLKQAQYERSELIRERDEYMRLAQSRALGSSYTPEETA